MNFKKNPDFFGGNTKNGRKQIKNKQKKRSKKHKKYCFWLYFEHISVKNFQFEQKHEILEEEKNEFWKF